MKKRYKKIWLKRRIGSLPKEAISTIARSAVVMPPQDEIAAEVNDRAIKYGNCLDCPDHGMFAVRNSDDWFGMSTDVRCEAADGRVIIRDPDSMFVRADFAVPIWCPRRCANKR